MRLRSEGGIKALLGMVRCRHPDVLSQVARGIANFAKCESRASAQGKCIVYACIVVITTQPCQLWTDAKDRHKTGCMNGFFSSIKSFMLMVYSCLS